MNFQIFIISFLGLYIYAKWKYTYWKRRGLPYHKPIFPFGSYRLPNRTLIHAGEILKIFYNQFKSLGHKHFGIFLMMKPVYIVIHPESIKQIMVKNFNYFNSRGFYYNAKDDPMSASFPFLEGEEWKIRRQKLTPAFSSGKIKLVFHIFQQCSDQFVSAIAKVSENQNAIDIRNIIDYFTTNAMGASAFGLECKSYEDKNDELQKYGKEYFSPLSPLQLLKWIIAYYNKSLAHFLKISLLPRNVTEFYSNVFHDTVQFRETSKLYRSDLMQQLIDLKNEGLSQATKTFKFTLTDYQQMIADAFALKLTGLESSSSAINFCLFELAAHQDIQQKVRDEIKRVTAKDKDTITYDNLLEMKYLNQVLHESLRKYPLTPILSRICTKDYKVPNANVTIEKGTFTIIPVLALHYDSDYYPEPHKFDPERFNDANKDKILPFTYLPFGEGPRICIAARFGFTLSKLCVAVMVKNFVFTLNEKTSPDQKFDPFNHSFSFKNRILMDIKKL